MEADDLDNLIADSLGGVQSVLDAEKKATPAVESAASAGEAVKELQQGPAAGDDKGDEECFAKLVRSFQDESFQKAMAEVLQEGGMPGAGGDAGGGPGAAGTSEGAGVEDFLLSFLGSFEDTMGCDNAFAKSITSLMTSMLSNDLILQPLQQVAAKLEQWLQQQKSLPESERSRYEGQLHNYREMVNIYQTSPDPLPEEKRRQVQALLTDLHDLGQPPDAVMKELAPKEAKADSESFEDFVKSMGLVDGLSKADQDVLQKLADDPEELTRVMRDMARKIDAEGPGDEACNQQ